MVELAKLRADAVIEPVALSRFICNELRASAKPGTVSLSPVAKSESF